MKAIGYIRVSTDKQELGREAQETGIRAWCDRHGCQLVQILQDVDVHGDSACFERPGLQDAMVALRREGATVLVALKRDRVARSPLEILLLERELSRAGLQLQTADGLSEEQTPEAALLRGIIDLVGAYELAQIRSRTKAALAAARAAGEHLGGIPYGWQRSEHGLTPHQRELECMARIQAMHTEGCSCRRIADRVYAEGYRTRKGTRIAPTAVRRILTRA